MAFARPQVRKRLSSIDLSVRISLVNQVKTGKRAYFTFCQVCYVPAAAAYHPLWTRGNIRPTSGEMQELACWGRLRNVRSLQVHL